MTTFVNPTFMHALEQKPVAYTPVWLMRQAGRYLPEYRSTRAKAGDFMALAQNPELATEVTLQPIDLFDLDAAILFSDILTIPDAMGLGLSFGTGEGPRFAHPLQDENSIRQLRAADLSQLQYVFDAVQSITSALQTPAGQRVPLIGFSGSPWTLACYMIEGKGGDFITARRMLYQRPELVSHILKINTQSIVDYLQAQIEHGANALMIFDTWGGLLSHAHYKHFSLGPMRTIVATLRQKYPHIPLILFTKGGGVWLEEMSNTGAQALGLDWTVDLGAIAKTIGQRITLQGNVDPLLMTCDHEATIRQEVKRIVKAGQQAKGFVFNLGHGLTPEAKPDNVRILVDEIRQHPMMVSKKL